MEVLTLARPWATAHAARVRVVTQPTPERRRRPRGVVNGRWSGHLKQTSATFPASRPRHCLRRVASRLCRDSAACGLVLRCWDGSATARSGPRGFQTERTC